MVESGRLTDCKQASKKKSTILPITAAEFETLVYISLGLTDKAIARKTLLSVRGVQNRTAGLVQKLLPTEIQDCNQNNFEVINLRCRLVFEAFRQGLLDPNQLRNLDFCATDARLLSKSRSSKLNIIFGYRIELADCTDQSA
jgi:hypothetical protein